MAKSDLNYKYSFCLEITIIENLVLSGGGIKGYIHIGVLKALQEKGYLNTIKRFCGTSIGAFVSLLLVLSLSPEQIEELFLQMNLQAFLQLIPEQILSLFELIACFY